MLNKIKKLMLEYADIYSNAWSNLSFKHPIANMVRNDITNDLRAVNFLNSDIYKVKASCGTGRFTAVPWIAIFDLRITSSAQKGIYVVYLLNKDSKELYLTLAHAVTRISISELKEKARFIQKQLGIDYCEPIHSGSDEYDAGCIFSKKYTVEDLNDEEAFLTDLKFFIDLYSRYQQYNEKGIKLEIPNNKLDKQKESFKSWLKNNNSHNYTDHVIYKYIRALEMVEEWLSIKLPTSIFSITTLDELEKCDRIIKSVPNFIEINKDHGHGDLSAALSAYAKYLKDITASNDIWWPSQEEYPLNLTKEDWKKYILEVELPNHPSPMQMLKAMMELGGEANFKKLSEVYGGTVQAYNEDIISLGRRIKNYFNLPSCMDEDQEKFSPFPFQSKKDNDQTNNIYRIRTELYEALQEIDLSAISPYYVDKPKPETGSFYSWEIIDNITAVKTCDKSFFDYNSSGVPKEICWFFGVDTLEDGENKELYFIFNGQQYKIVANKYKGSVTILWPSSLGKLFKKYKDCSAKATFEKKSSDTYETTISTENSGEQTMTAKEQIEAVKNYIAAKGFNYDGALIENFYLSLKSKPFVILAGTSGTGKTRLVRLFAEAINAEYKLVAVRPDWSDSSDLFGHVDLNQKFIPGAVIDFVKKAELNPAKPYFLCLDEMNLARVEYYMSDILSAIETRRFDNKGLTTDPVFDSVNYGNDTAAAERYGDVVLPGNLYIIGTVNMDETTFPFSKKVLDRANTIEFSHVDLSALPAFDSEEPESFNASNNFLVSEYIKLNDCSISDRDYISSISEKLAVINDILKIADAHVGYRVRDEIVFYMLNNKKAELLDENTAFDNQIMQKILPRVHGSSSVIKTMLEELGKHCESDKYVASAEKIKFMIKRYEDDGFTSYWL